MTPKQQKCLDVIQRLTVDGIPPSFEEIRLHMGLASKSGVHRMVHALADRGYISFTPNSKRTLQIVTRRAEAIPFDRMAKAVLHHVAVRLSADLPVSSASIRAAMVQSFKRAEMSQ